MMNNKHLSENKRNGPVKLAVTGGVGSGKSVVCERLRYNGVPVYSADDLARLAVEPGTTAYRKIVSSFGEDMLLPDRSLDRSKLRGVITRDQKAREMLEEFIHPEVIAQMKGRFEAADTAGDLLVAVEVPLLFEAGLEGYFDYVVAVSVDREKRIDRIMERDGVLQDDAEALINIQMPEEEKCERSDFIIDNNGCLADTYRAVDQLYMRLIRIGKKKVENS